MAFIDITDRPYTQLLELYSAQLLYFTRYGRNTPQQFVYPHVNTMHPDWERRIHASSQRFYLAVEE